MKKIIIMIMAGLGVSLSSIPAYAASGSCSVAKTVADISDCVFPQVGNLQILISALAYLGGLTLGIKGILKLKEHNEKKGQMSIGIPIAMITAATLLLSLPTAVNFGMITLGIADWTGDAESAHGGTTRDYNQFKY